jgi:hypothetical protein
MFPEKLVTALAAATLLAPIAAAQDSPGSPAVVCNIKVLSDKVPDVSNLEAWKKSFIKEGMSDKEKALAVWKSVVSFHHQETPPNEFLQMEGNVLDPIKLFNVYGYSLCSVSAGEVTALARYIGLEARGWTIHNHCVPEVKWNNAWHLMDPSLINYFPKPNGGDIASVAEICEAVQGWLKEHPELKGDDKKLREFQWREGGTNWKKNGPELLKHSPFYNERGWWPAKTHGWYSTMQEYDGGKNTPFDWISQVSLGYQLNIQLRDGEVLTRNWSHKGLHVNMDGNGGTPGVLTMQTGKDSLRYTPDYGDIAPGRIGNGRLEYTPPLGSLQYSALAFDNLNVNGQSITTVDASKPGTLVIRMPSSYVYLTGELALKASVGNGGSIAVSYSDNNGLDYKPLETITQSGEKTIDLSKRVFRRYDYRLKFQLTGQATAIQGLKISHDIQHSQRPLPALTEGKNTISFSAGDPTSTVTVEGSPNLEFKDKQLVYTDFHPKLENISGNLKIDGPAGSATFPVETPGNLTKLRIGCAYRSWDRADGIDVEVSFDGGKTFKPLAPFGKSETFHNRYLEFTDIPEGTRSAHVRFAAKVKNALQWTSFHINADYKPANAGFRPVKVTYIWEEDGKEKTSVHVAQKPEETYTIQCAAKPTMKSVSLELAR